MKAPEEYNPNERIEEATSVADGTEAEAFFSHIAMFLTQFADNGGFVHRHESKTEKHHPVPMVEELTRVDA